MYVFILVTLTFFAVLGIAVFITSIIRSRSNDEKMQLVLLDLKKDDAEIRVRRAVRICEETHILHLICDCTDEEAFKICKKLRETEPVVEPR